MLGILKLLFYERIRVDSTIAFILLYVLISCIFILRARLLCECMCWMECEKITYWIFHMTVTKDALYAIRTHTNRRTREHDCVYSRVISRQCHCYQICPSSDLAHLSLSSAKLTFNADSTAFFPLQMSLESYGSISLLFFLMFVDIWAIYDGVLCVCQKKVSDIRSLCNGNGVVMACMTCIFHIHWNRSSYFECYLV